MDSNRGDVGIYRADNLVQAVVDQDLRSNVVRKLQGKEPIKTKFDSAGKNTLPTPNSTFKGIQSSHCITYDRVAI